MKATFKCMDCKETKPVHTDGGTGYARTRAGRKVCYACCAVRDVKDMQRTGRAVLYLTRKANVGEGLGYMHSWQPHLWEVTNWPGTLRFTVAQLRKGHHNIAGERVDVWFHDSNGTTWHGVQLGSNTQIVRCKRLTRKAA